MCLRVRYSSTLCTSDLQYGSLHMWPCRDDVECMVHRQSHWHFPRHEITNYPSILDRWRADDSFQTSSSTSHTTLPSSPTDRLMNTVVLRANKWKGRQVGGDDFPKTRKNTNKVATDNFITWKQRIPIFSPCFYIVTIEDGPLSHVCYFATFERKSTSYDVQTFGLLAACTVTPALAFNEKPRVTSIGDSPNHAKRVVAMDCQCGCVLDHKRSTSGGRPCENRRQRVWNRLLWINEWRPGFQHE